MKLLETHEITQVAGGRDADREVIAWERRMARQNEINDFPFIFPFAYPWWALTFTNTP
jgi:hypothetical protein